MEPNTHTSQQQNLISNSTLTCLAFDARLELDYCAAIDQTADNFNLTHSTELEEESYAHLSLQASPTNHSHIVLDSDSEAISFDNFLYQLNQLHQETQSNSNTKVISNNLKYKICRADKRCAICHQLVKKKSPIYSLKCRHIYHSNCLSQWLKIKDNCPLCRKEIE